MIEGHFANAERFQRWRSIPLRRGRHLNRLSVRLTHHKPMRLVDKASKDSRHLSQAAQASREEINPHVTGACLAPRCKLPAITTWNPSERVGRPALILEIYVKKNL